MLMDEPTAGMTPRSRRDLMRWRRASRERDNVAVLFTEHDMDIVFGFADRVHRARSRRADRARVTGRDQGEPARPGGLPRAGRAGRRVTSCAKDDVSPGYGSGITGAIASIQQYDWYRIRMALCSLQGDAANLSPKREKEHRSWTTPSSPSAEACSIFAVQGMSDYERMQATARMEQAMMLGDAALRVADRARAALRRAAIVLFGAPATQKRA